MPRTGKRCYKTKEKLVTDNKQLSRICRGCLATGRRMMKATSYKGMVKDLTGIIISPTDGLPPGLCYECSGLLRKCVKFRNKIIKSHNKLRQYVLKNVPFDLDKDTTPFLTRTLPLHLHVPGSQDNTIGIIKCEDDDIEVKSELISCDRENIAEKDYSVENHVICPDNPPQLQIDIISGVTSTIEEQIEQEEELNFNRYELCGDGWNVPPELNPVIKLVKLNDKDLRIHKVTETQSSNEEPSQASSQEPHVGTEAAQQHLDKHVGTSRRWRHDKERQHPADNTSARHSDDTEEEVKHNMYRDDSVHIISRSNVQSYICDTCNKCFSGKDLLIRHIRDHSAEKSFKYDVCYKRFLDESTFTKHSRVHTAAKLYQHRRKNYNEKLYSGDVSDKRSNSDTSLTVMHTSAKPYKCVICMIGFGSKSKLNTHMHSHLGEKTYMCEVCMKYFGRMDRLKNHMRVHTGDKPYKCDVCVKCFSCKQYLKDHMIVHTGDKPNKCDVCMKFFANKGSLSRHMRMHTGDKPYKCDVCMKCFDRKDNLQIHMRLHSGVKPYKCDVCLKYFTQKGSLSRHIRTHTGNKPSPAS